MARLDGPSLASLLASLSGTKDEKLLRERQEAVAARLRYEEACVRVERLSAELGGVDGELAGLAGLESEHCSLLAEKERVMRNGEASGTRELERLAQVEQQVNWHLRELREARTAGDRADAAMAEALSVLGSARSWGIWDIVGGGLIATAIKHIRIDAAREKLQQAQADISLFRRELRDVTTALDMPPAPELDGFIRFADYVFDGLFVDVIVQNRINESIALVRQARAQVGDLRTWVDRQATKVEAEIASVQGQRRQHVEEYRA